jgi:hypothetical protein
MHMSMCMYIAHGCWLWHLPNQGSYKRPTTSLELSRRWPAIRIVYSASSAASGSTCTCLYSYELDAEFYSRYMFTTPFYIVVIRALAHRILKGSGFPQIFPVLRSSNQLRLHQGVHNAGTRHKRDYCRFDFNDYKCCVGVAFSDRTGVLIGVHELFEMIRFYTFSRVGVEHRCANLVCTSSQNPKP